MTLRCTPLLSLCTELHPFSLHYWKALLLNHYFVPAFVSGQSQQTTECRVHSGHFLFCKWGVIRILTHSFVYIFSFALWQTWVVVTKTVWSTKSKYLLYGHSLKRLAGPCARHWVHMQRKMDAICVLMEFSVQQTNTWKIQWATSLSVSGTSDLAWGIKEGFAREVRGSWVPKDAWQFIRQRKKEKSVIVRGSNFIHSFVHSFIHSYDFSQYLV